MLSSRGYSLAKADLSKDELETIRRELSVSPDVPKDYKVGPDVTFRLFQESEGRIYVPKCYGLERYGPPKVDRLSEGTPIAVAFAGALRPEQQAPVELLLSACLDPAQMGGILNVFCGGGKTTMALYVAAKLARKALIVVHKDFLLEQWRERIGQFLPAARVGLIKAKKVDIVDKDVVIASLQSLSMKEYDLDTFAEFGTVIIDEVHHTSAEVFSRALAKVAFRYTVGLTATVTRRDGLTKVFLWYLGRIVHRAEKRVDEVNVRVVRYFADEEAYCEEPTIFNGKPNVAKMINNLCDYAPRNEKIMETIGDVMRREPARKLLVLSDRRAHLRRLHCLCEAAGYSTGIYLGGMKQSVLAECATKQVIVATYAIASEGYDQKGLDTLLLASPRSDVVQSVGRILRDKVEDRRHVPLVIDVVDAFSVFQRQGYKRVNYYRECGWNVFGQGKKRIDDSGSVALRHDIIKQKMVTSMFVEDDD